MSMVSRNQNYSAFPLPADHDWGKWRLLEMLSDFVLFYVKGDIVEIGIGETTSNFTALSLKFNRIVYHCDISSMRIDEYEESFNRERNSVSVCSSDDFFRDVKLSSIALGFIDGAHMYDQVKKDFENLFMRIVDDGYIFIHDTYPLNAELTKDDACSTSYILRQELEKDNRVDCFTFPESSYGVGLTMVRKKPKNLSFCQK